MKKLTTLAAAVTLAALTASTSSFAGLTGQAYVGARAGWARLMNTEMPDTDGVDFGDYFKWTKNGYGLGLYGGYNFTDWFALELDATYMSHFKLKGKNEQGKEAAKYAGGSDKIKINAFELALAAKFAYNFDQDGSNVFLRFGPAWSHVHAKHLGSDDTCAGLVGAGLEYAFTRNLAARIGYDYYFHAWRDNGGKADIGLLYAGFQYQFGGAAAPVAVSQPVTRTHTLDAGTLFAFDSSRLSPLGSQTIADVAASSRNLENPTFEVYGYTDRLGSDAYNQRLSERRAATVAQALNDSGVTPDQVTVIEGRGKSNPVTGDQCNGVRGKKALIDCLQPDRRVEVVVNGVQTETVPAK